MINKPIEQQKNFKKFEPSTRRMDKLVENIIWYRKHKKWSQEEMGAVFNLNRNNIASYERGAAQPGLEFVSEICKDLSVYLHEFIYEDMSTYRRAVSNVLNDGGEKYVKNKDKLLERLEHQLKTTQEMISILSEK